MVNIVPFCTVQYDTMF